MKSILLDLKIFFLLVFISLLLIFFDNLNFLFLPKQILQTATIPIQYGFYQTGKNFINQFNFIFLARKAYLENEALKKQLAEVINDKAHLAQNLKETQDLIDQYNKLNPRTYNLLPARILFSNRYLILDKGAADGLKGNETVVYKENYLGRIKSISPKTSQVMLVADPQSKIAVFSQGGLGRAKGIISGQFGSELLMDKILHEEEINRDDFVYSEGTEGVLPKGLVIGRVTEILDRQNEVFKQAKVEPIYKTIDLDNVFIILNP